jgi:hypothetical protein
MPLFTNVFGPITIAAGATIGLAWSFVPGYTDNGPNYVSAHFIGGGDSGVVTTVQTSVYFWEEAPGYIPLRIGYQALLRNDGSASAVIGLNIGLFQ